MQAQVSAVISGIGYASTYLVKWPTDVRKKLFLLGVSGYAPVMSMEVISNGKEGVSASLSGAICFREPLRLWQEWQFLI
jgi:hypothetical protein